MKRGFAAAALAASLIFGIAGHASADKKFATEHYSLQTVTVADGLERPWGLAWLPDGQMLVTEKAGRLRIVSKDGLIGPAIKNVPKVDDSGQGGLLDVLVDPKFEDNNILYFSYSEKSKEGSGTAVARARLADNELYDVKVLFRQYPKVNSGYHFGSRLVMARDGALFITIGERGERKLAQDTRVNRGQVIRISTEGDVPDSNPFAGKSGKRPEIWSYGHRNPQGAALHPETGELWVVEHGARGGDELNRVLAGKNYGWPVISYGRHYSGLKIGEGTKKAGMEQPIHYWDPSIAPSGLAFYTGDKYPKWTGNLFVGALKFRLLVRLELDGTKVVHEERLVKDLGKRIRDVRQGPDGYLYLLTDADPGQILRLEPTESLASH